MKKMNMKNEQLLCAYFIAQMTFSIYHLQLKQ